MSLDISNQWQVALIEELVSIGILTPEHENDPKLALYAIIDWHVQVALDPAVSEEAQQLIEWGRVAGRQEGGKK